jgi:hypothetical protein
MAGVLQLLSSLLGLVSVTMPISLDLRTILNILLRYGDHRRIRGGRAGAHVSLR